MRYEEYACCGLRGTTCRSRLAGLEGFGTTFDFRPVRDSLPRLLPKGSAWGVSGMGRIFRLFTPFYAFLRILGNYFYFRRRAAGVAKFAHRKGVYRLLSAFVGFYRLLGNFFIFQRWRRAAKHRKNREKRVRMTHRSRKRGRSVHLRSIATADRPPYLSRSVSRYARLNFAGVESLDVAGGSS